MQEPNNVASQAAAAAPDEAAIIPANVAASGSEVERIRSEYPNLVGVRGWLLWFCIGTTIIGPATTLYLVFADPDIYSVFDVALAAFPVVVGINLWRVTPKALRLTKILLIIEVCVWALLTVEHIVLLATGGTGIAPGAPRMLIFAIVWLFYFKKSKRVMATYGRSL